MDTDVLVIGAGQCGLAASRELSQRGIEHEVVDAGSAPGDVWRHRWDSLRLFTPARFDALPGLVFPGSSRYSPSAAEFVDYLEAYVDRFNLPVRMQTRVQRVAVAPEGGFAVASDTGTRRARRVVVATGGDNTPRIPAAGADLDPRTVQLHTAAYHRPEDLPEGTVLVVGCGTSGIQLGIELAEAGRNVTVAGTPTMKVPRALLKVAGGAWFAFLHRVLTRATPIGRRAAVNVIGSGAPLVGISPRDLTRAGVRRGPRLTGAVDGLPQLADGSVIEADAVLWATGYRPDFSWIEGLAVDEHGLPAHDRGLSRDIPGLAFLGLPFQFGLTSTLIGGAGRDAEFVATALARTLSEDRNGALA